MGFLCRCCKSFCGCTYSACKNCCCIIGCCYSGTVFLLIVLVVLFLNSDVIKVSLNGDGDGDGGGGFTFFSRDFESTEDTCYHKLNSTPESTQKEIQKQFRRLALIYHPDKIANESAKEESSKVFQELSACYQILSDEDSRRKYDAGGFRENKYGDFDFAWADVFKEAYKQFMEDDDDDNDDKTTKTSKKKNNNNRHRKANSKGRNGRRARTQSQSRTRARDQERQRERQRAQAQTQPRTQPQKTRNTEKDYPYNSDSSGSKHRKTKPEKEEPEQSTSKNPRTTARATKGDRNRNRNGYASHAITIDLEDIMVDHTRHQRLMADDGGIDGDRGADTDTDTAEMLAIKVPKGIPNGYQIMDDEHRLQWTVRVNSESVDHSWIRGELNLGSEPNNLNNNANQNINNYYNDTVSDLHTFVDIQLHDVLLGSDLSVLLLNGSMHTLSIDHYYEDIQSSIKIVNGGLPVFGTAHEWGHAYIHVHLVYPLLLSAAQKHALHETLDHHGLWLYARVDPALSARHQTQNHQQNGNNVYEDWEELDSKYDL